MQDKRILTGSKCVISRESTEQRAYKSGNKVEYWSKGNMEAARRLFTKLRLKDKAKSSNEAKGNGKECSKSPVTDEDVPSHVTKQRSEVAKQYIENHYKKQTKILQERRERYVLSALVLNGMGIPSL